MLWQKIVAVMCSLFIWWCLTGLFYSNEFLFINAAPLFCHFMCCDIVTKWIETANIGRVDLILHHNLHQYLCPLRTFFFVLHTTYTYNGVLPPYFSHAIQFNNEIVGWCFAALFSQDVSIFKPFGIFFFLIEIFIRKVHQHHHQQQ